MMPFLMEAITDAVCGISNTSIFVTQGLTFTDAWRKGLELWRQSEQLLEPELFYRIYSDAPYRKEHIEEIKSPSRTWASGGDCDDWAMLVCCIGRRTGAILGRWPDGSGHVINVAHLGSDPTRYGLIDLTLQNTSPPQRDPWPHVEFASSTHAIIGAVQFYRFKESYFLPS